MPAAEKHRQSLIKTRGREAKKEKKRETKKEKSHF